MPTRAGAAPAIPADILQLDISPAIDGNGRLAAFGRAWLMGYGSPHTRRAYRKDLELWCEWCEASDLDPWYARRAHVDTYARSMEAAGLSQRTRARRIASLAKFYRYLVVEGPLEHSPVTDVERPKVSRNRSTTFGLNKDQTRALLAQAAKHSLRSHALVQLLVGNGLRISEALNAEIADMSTKRGHRVLTVYGKGEHTDDVALAPPTIAAIDAYLAAEGRTEGLIFTTGSGRRMQQWDAYRLLGRLVRRAGIEVPKNKNLSPHGLRHTAITGVLDAGATLREAQDFARHADPRTTRLYDLARNNLDSHAAYRLASWLADDSPQDE